MTDYLISGPAIYTEHDVLCDHFLTTHQGLIQGISNKKISKSQRVLEFPNNYHLVPGFIDLHIHGANGFDVMDGTPEALWGMKKALAAEGVTGFLATTMSASHTEIKSALQNIQETMQKQQASQGAIILGVHLEGPFISAEKKGAQPADFIVSSDQSYFKKLQAFSNNTIKLVTLAPEIENIIELVHYLKQQKIIASIGHTNATFTETMQAITEGCTYATHVFNAMRGIHQREPGAVTAALLSNEVTTELIADGQHLHPAIIELILRLKPIEKTILVTDAMRAKCLTDGTYELGGQSVSVISNKATLKDGTLAGSVLTFPQAIKNMHQWTTYSLSQLFKMTAENQAKLLGLFHQIGSLQPKKMANLVVLDEKLNTVFTMIAGEIVFNATGRF